MPFIVYLAILIAAVFSVGLEWDALVEPSAATRHEIRAVTELGSPPRQAAPASSAAAPAVQTAVPAAAPAAAPAPAAASAAVKPAEANPRPRRSRRRRRHRRNATSTPAPPPTIRSAPWIAPISPTRGRAGFAPRARGPSPTRRRRRAPRGWRRIAISAAAPKPTVRSIRAIAPTSRSRARGGGARSRYYFSPSVAHRRWRARSRATRLRSQYCPLTRPRRLRLRSRTLSHKGRGKSGCRSFNKPPRCGSTCPRASGRRRR